MNSLAAWGPTLVTVIGWIFFGGVMWQKQHDSERRHDEADGRITKIDERQTVQEVAIAKLNSWKDGYAAARSIYDGRHATGD